jgi:hypothetical protein
LPRLLTAAFSVLSLFKGGRRALKWRKGWLIGSPDRQRVDNADGRHFAVGYCRLGGLRPGARSVAGGPTWIRLWQLQEIGGTRRFLIR